MTQPDETPADRWLRGDESPIAELIKDAYLHCDWGGCQTEPVVTLTACYPWLDTAPHPTWKSYPAPMFRACRNHMAVLIDQDTAAPGSTNAFIVQPI